MAKSKGQECSHNTRFAVCKVHTNLMGLRRKGHDGRPHNTRLQEALQFTHHGEVLRPLSDACGKMGSGAREDSWQRGSLLIARCYANIEGDDRGAKWWDRLSTVWASFRATTTIVMAGDFNGHVEAGARPNGPLHLAQSNNTNGDRLIGACTIHNLTLVNT